MTRFKQVYAPAATIDQVTVRITDKRHLQQFKKGSKLMLRARAGRVLEVDHENGTVRLAFIPEHTTLYAASPWLPVPDEDEEESSELVSFMPDLT
jgi:hypothetical protein